MTFGLCHLDLNLTKVEVINLSQKPNYVAI